MKSIVYNVLLSSSPGSSLVFKCFLKISSLFSRHQNKNQCYLFHNAIKLYKKNEYVLLLKSWVKGHCTIFNIVSAYQCFSLPSSDICSGIVMKRWQQSPIIMSCWQKSSEMLSLLISKVKSSGLSGIVVLHLPFPWWARFSRAGKELGYTWGSTLSHETSTMSAIKQADGLNWSIRWGKLVMVNGPSWQWAEMDAHQTYYMHAIQYLYF